MKDAIRILSCSPRTGGNTDIMVHNFVQGVRASGGKAEISWLRDYTILPCTACHFCAEDADSKCLLAARDDAEKLFRQIEEAPLVCISSPIFFYHLPAQLKALVDRAQRYWARRRRREKEGAGQDARVFRPALVNLVAARTRGDRLFDGSVLTLQYFLDLFDTRIADGCRLMGYDHSDELACDGVACMRLYELGVKAAALVAENAGRR